MNRRFSPAAAALAASRTPSTPLQVLRSWPTRRWAAAAAFALATVLLAALSTAMIPNPAFGRAVPTTVWAWPVLIVTAVLGGLVGATYVRAPGDPAPVTKVGVVGGLLSYFAVGCPVCNKLVLLALGYSGALQWFAPAQPFLAAAGLALLAYALVRRLRAAQACPIPGRS
ncbi:hypothetical protein [Propioniciclava tarda]|uniref:hypothetical protein n=1 Tax=Propioniciclava tarda TaxID=433330 RepID=UPI00116CE483|nr:hypothetical protein [Propioniciclava tarda]SMO37665.1 hypothetical protein SAMN06266982_101369 [Propioniciclava tarda]